MYCPECGTPNDKDSRFCKNCGNPLGTALEPSTRKKGDTNKILKRDKFGLKEKTIGFPEKGVLTLYCNRLEWEGTQSFSVPIGDIIDVSVQAGLGSNTLKITDQEGTMHFHKMDTPSFVMGLANLEIAAMMNKGGDLQSWREMIDRLRSGL